MKITYEIFWEEWQYKEDANGRDCSFNYDLSEVILCEGDTEADCEQQRDDIGYARADKGPFTWKKLK
jgi:hypothetical protein